MHYVPLVLTIPALGSKKVSNRKQVAHQHLRYKNFWPSRRRGRPFKNFPLSSTSFTMQNSVAVKSCCVGICRSHIFLGAGSRSFGREARLTPRTHGSPHNCYHAKFGCFRDTWQFWLKIANFSHGWVFTHLLRWFPPEFCNGSGTKQTWTMLPTRSSKSATKCAFVQTQSNEQL